MIINVTKFNNLYSYNIIILQYHEKYYNYITILYNNNIRISK